MRLRYFTLITLLLFVSFPISCNPLGNWGINEPLIDFVTIPYPFDVLRNSNNDWYIDINMLVTEKGGANTNFDRVRIDWYMPTDGWAAITMVDRHWDLPANGSIQIPISSVCPGQYKPTSISIWIMYSKAGNGYSMCKKDYPISLNLSRQASALQIISPGSWPSPASTSSNPRPHARQR